MRSPGRWPLALAAGSIALLAASCDLAEPPHLLQVGHVDGFAVHVDDGELEVHIHDDSGAEPVERDPASTVLHALPGTKTQVPNNPNFAFLGPAGADVWILPQTQRPDILWLGWETQGISPGVLQGNQLTWRVTGVDGPGDFSVFTVGAFGAPTVIFNSADGLPDSRVVPTGVHVHGNWGFTAPGEYTVTFEATATLADGTPVSSGPVPYTFTVDSYACGDVDDLTLPASVEGGSAVDVTYDYSNCGADPSTADVQARVTAPEACGKVVTNHGIDSHSLAPGAAEAGSGSFTAPTCPGTYTVSVRGHGPANSYIQQVNLTVN